MKNFLSLFASILMSALIAVWFSQNPINAYWQQTYHRNSPLEPLAAYGWWRSGAALQENAYALSDGIKAFLSGETPTTTQDGGSADMPSEAAASEAVPQTGETEWKQDTEAAAVRSGDKVFFAGDSLMQGVAPFVQKSLKQQYGIESVNLSKQSTGLSYPSFFDWPKTIEETLQKHPEISVLAVFLGPNDPWDFPVGKRYLKFASDEWAQEYLKRVDRILEAAHTHHVQVVWLGIPYMKKAKLDGQMRYLDKLLSEHLEGKIILIPTAHTLSGGEDRYTDSVNVNGKSVRYRSKDGIHFTAEGQKLLAAKIMEKIVFEPSTQPSSTQP